MYEDVVRHPLSAATANPYTYTVAENVWDIATTMQSLSATVAEQFALVTIALYFTHDGKGPVNSLADIEKSTRYFLDNLRPLVRKTDRVFLLKRTYYFILLGANIQGGSIVQERLWEALLWRVHTINTTEILCPCTMTIGHSAYPLPCRDVQQCLAAASAARLSFDMQPEKSARQMAVQTVGDAELPHIARKLGIPYLSLLPRHIPARVRQLVTPRLARELHCYPLGCARDTLTIALLHPDDQQALERLHQETGMRIFPVLTHPQELQTALELFV